MAEFINFVLRIYSWLSRLQRWCCCITLLYWIA